MKNFKKFVFSLSCIVFLVIAFIFSSSLKKRYILRVDEHGWDEHIREIGNVIYNEKRREYYLYYSGHRDKNQRGKNDIYVGVASSTDFVHWEKHGKALDVYAEDPFVIFCRESYWMFYEEKSRIPDVSISLAKSTDGKRFTVFERDIITPTPSSFQSRDTSSPVAVCLDDRVVVLYEAREEGFIGATLGYAESSDFVHWSQLDVPVAKLGENRFIVPDDIMLLDGEYTLIFHDVDELFSIGRTDWLSRTAKSKNLIHWEIDSGNLNRADYSMFYGDDFISSNEKGIFVIHSRR